MRERDGLGDIFHRFEEQAAKDDIAMERAKMDDGRDYSGQILGDHINRLLCGIAGLDDSVLANKQAGLQTQLSLAESHVMARAKFLGIENNDFLISRMEHAEARVNHVIGLCESPIEKLVLPWLVLEDFGPEFQTFPAEVFHCRRDRFLPAGDIIIAPQFAFVRFRFDFAVIARHRGNVKIVAVECDGAEFHDASKDAERDLFLRGFGIETVRAYGADIHQRPRNLTHRAADIINEWASK